jgi:hypothetical protein
VVLKCFEKAEAVKGCGWSRYLAANARPTASSSSRETRRLVGGRAGGQIVTAEVVAGAGEGGRAAPWWRTHCCTRVAELVVLVNAVELFMLATVHELHTPAMVRAAAATRGAFTSSHVAAPTCGAMDSRQDGNCCCRCC